MTKKTMQERKYISVGEMAQYLGKTRQYVYNLLHNGKLSGYEFSRNTMRGWLVEKPSNFDEWQRKQATT